MQINTPVFKSLAALSVGTLGMCMSEFSMMGILPQIAHGTGVDITIAGHFISAYALGVCVGAPLLVIFARTRPLRNILIFLMCAFIAGNALTALAGGYWSMIGARFVAGMPHGAYFGVASIVAAELAGAAYAVRAVAIVVFGATIANLLGVPFSTFAAWLVSWRLAYFIVAFVGIVTIFCILRWVPRMRGLKDTGFAGEFRFLRSPAPWIITFAIIMGNGGMFCWYSYVTPFMRHSANIPEAWMTGVMLLAGFGMVVGNIVSGKLSLRFSAARLALAFQLLLAVTLFLIYFFGKGVLPALMLMTLGTGCLFGLSAPQQMLLLQTSQGGQMLGAALAQVGFNLGNAVGAYAGGLAPGNGSFAPAALVGSSLALVGFVLLVIYNRKFAKDFEGNI